MLKVLVNVVNRPMRFATISASAQLYFKSIINSFDILALSKHCLFEEQHSLLKTATDGTYNYHASSSCDNPCIAHASGERAYGGAVLLSRYSIEDFVTLLIILILTALSTLNMNLTVKGDYLFSVFIFPAPVIALRNIENVLTFFGRYVILCQLMTIQLS